MNTLFQKLFSSANSLRVFMGIVSVVLITFKDKLGLDDAAINKILLVIGGLIGADTWRPLHGPTAPKTNETPS